jgi:hypothetical protein
MHGCMYVCMYVTYVFLGKVCDVCGFEGGSTPTAIRLLGMMTVTANDRNYDLK